MTDKFTEMTSALHRYAVEHSDSDPLLRELAQETDGLGDVAVMMMAPEQGALTTLLVRAIGARRALEIGTFTGYGALCIARGLPEDGHLLALDVNEDWTAIGRRYWERAGLADRIELRIGPALETLAELPADDPFDFVFIDADKESYPAYYEEALRLLRSGGVMVIDNVFRRGTVLDPDDNEPPTVAIRELNDRIASDERVISAMVSVADGITLALKL
jgi:caffeoyl-CoA O-methyltransferase